MHPGPFGSGAETSKSSRSERLVRERPCRVHVIIMTVRKSKKKIKPVHFDEENKAGKNLGVVEKKFQAWGEIQGKIIYLHFICSKCERQGNVQRLIQSWLEQGYAVAVIRPCVEMQHILSKYGFEDMGEEDMPEHYKGGTSVWRCYGTVFI